MAGAWERWQQRRGASKVSTSEGPDDIAAAVDEDEDDDDDDDRPAVRSHGRRGGRGKGARASMDSSDDEEDERSKSRTTKAMSRVVTSSVMALDD